MKPSEMDILEIISDAWHAKNFYIEAIQEAKSSNYEGCNELIRKGNELYAKAHRVHQQLVSEEASGNEVVITLLLSHAQNILASADSFKVLCDEFIDLYRRVDEISKK